MSKEAEEFFRQKTIENAKRPKIKKFLALVDREAEGKILQEYADQQLTLTDVSQQRELLIDFSRKIMFGEDWTPPLPYEQIVDDYLKGNL